MVVLWGLITNITIILLCFTNIHMAQISPHLVNTTFQITTDWWKMESLFIKSNDKDDRITHVYLQKYQYNNTDNDNNDNNITLMNSCYTYVATDANRKIVKSNVFCYPSLIVGGIGKCGTGAIYKLLSLATNTVTASVKKKKEYCMPFDKQMKISISDLIEYFDGFVTVFNAEMIIFNGCIRVTNNLIMNDILRQPKTKVIIAVRDFVDRFYAAYNYWCGQLYEKKCPFAGYWTRPEKHVRSAEIFHNISVNNFTYGVDSPINTREDRLDVNVSLCQSASDYYRYPIEKQYLNLVNNNNNSLIVIQSEHFSEEFSYYTKLLQQRFGLIFDEEKEEYKSFQLHRYNTNDHKGDNDKTLKSPIKVKNIYSISGNQPVYFKTRLFLNKCWYPDCIWINRFLYNKYNCSEMF